MKLRHRVAITRGPFAFSPFEIRYRADDARLGAPSTVRPLTYLHLPQRLEPYAHLIHQKLRLFPRRKVPALVEPVVMDEPGIRPLRPAPRRRDDFVRKNAYRNRDGDVLGAQVGLREALPVETSRRDCGVRQPEERGVVEHIVTLFWLTNTTISAARLYWE